MKLYSVKATPFGRSVEIVAHELGLTEDIEVVPTVVQPTKDNADYQRLNPLRKIPALVIEDGTLLADSGLICQYLAARVGDTHLFAQNAPQHWAVFNDYMLAKGMTDCLVAARYESAVRPEEKRSAEWLADLLGKVHATLARFESAPPQSDGRITIAAIALGAALGYLDFRFAGENWRARYPGLAAWSEPVMARPSFVATRPE